MAAQVVVEIMVLMVAILCFQPLPLLVVVMALLILEVAHQAEAVVVGRQVAQEEREILRQLPRHKAIPEEMVAQLVAVMAPVAVAVLVLLALMEQALLVEMVEMVQHQLFQVCQ
jgi:hypothetical protein